MTENIEDNNNGIVNIKQNGIEYTVWTHANVVLQYIKEDLKKRVPGKLIVRELNKIDLAIPEENLPVEIQTTPVSRREITGSPTIRYAKWENFIRNQIERDIIPYGKCLFFFDSEFFRAMRNATKGMSINMDWFRKYMKEDKLKVFTVSYNGIIEEKTYKDFDFLAKKSETCKIAAETDEMTLNRNKMQIFSNAVKTFTQEEIDRFEDDYQKYREVNKDNSEDKNDPMTGFLMKQADKRAQLYGHILKFTGSLSYINRMFDGDIVGNHGLYEGTFIGIFESEGISNNNRMRFVDQSNTAQFFPAYIRHKDKWDEFKGKWLITKQMERIIKGDIDYNWYKEYENTNQDQINNDKEIRQNQNDDKEVNIKIDNKDHTININIKSKQKTIEDAWN